MADDELMVSDLANAVARKQQAFLQVNDRMEYLEDIANTALVDTKEYIRDLQELLESLEMPDFSEFDVELAPLNGIDYGSRPSLESFLDDVEFEDFDRELNLLSVDEISDEDVDFPEFAVPVPEYERIPRPELEEISSLPEPPDINAVSIPDKPSFSFPEKPNISDVSLPSAPVIDIPPFDETILPWDLAVPETFSWGEPVYVSDYWADLLTKILYGIRNGGTGLSEEVEQAIYNNHLLRTAEQNEKEIIAAETYYAARGFTLPSGLLSAKLSEIHNRIAKTNIEESNKIMISQAELAQKNTQFVIEKGIELESIARKFFIDHMTASINAQKMVLESSILVYNAAIDKIKLGFDDIRMKSEIWKTKAEHALTRLEIFKTEMEAAKVHVEVNKSKTELYATEMGAVELYVKVYNGQLEGAKIEAEIQSLKFSMYEALIKGFIAKVELNKSRVAMYEAELSGEKTKSEIYSSQVSAYSAEIAAKSKILDSLISKREFVIEQNKALILEFEAYSKVHIADTENKAKILSAKVDGFKALTDAYEAETNTESAHLRLQIQENEAIIQRENARIQQAIAKLSATTSAFEVVKKLQISGTEGIMNVGAQLAASAIQGINTSSSMSYGGSDSYNSSESTSYSKNHNINESVSINADV